MTAVLAGAIGGILALAGGFLVQILGDRERRRARARSLAAAFGADLQHVLIENARHRLSDEQKATFLEVLEAYDIATRSGAELALLSPPKLQKHIRETIENVRHYMFLAADVEGNDDEREKTVQELGNLVSALYAEFGTKNRGWSALRQRWTQ